MNTSARQPVESVVPRWLFSDRLEDGSWQTYWIVGKVDRLYFELDRRTWREIAHGEGWWRHL